MQSMLAQLAADREERENAKRQKENSTPQDAAQSNTGESGEQSRKKSRKQSNPVRYARGTPRAEAQTTADVIPPEASEKKSNGPAKRKPRAERGDGGSNKPTKSRKPASVPEPSTGEFVAPSSTFDAADIAGSFIADDFREGRNSLGEVAQDTFTAAARMHSVEMRKAKIVDAGDDEIEVTFTGNNRKIYKDHCRGYTQEQTSAIVREILSRNRGTKRRAASYKHLLTAQELSSRMPPLLWSLYRCSTDVGEVLEAMVAEHEGGGAACRQPQVYTLDSDSD